MKHCPTCNRSYTDANLSFCIDDGTPLKDDAPPYDPEATLVSPSPSASDAAPINTQGRVGDSNAPVYQPPSQFSQAPATRKQRVWPWVVGIIVLLLLGVVGLGIVAAIVVPNMMRAARNENSSSANTNERKEPANQNSNANENSNSSPGANENGTANNANSNSSNDVQPPTSEDLVLSQLTDLENEWSAANVNADKQKLARILADDYVGTQSGGKMQGKAEYLRDIKPDPRVKHWDFDDLKLTLKGDRATLKGTVSLEIDGQDREEVYDFTDKFVWRDGRWQAVASEVSPVK